jgi:hypothetical protein
MNAQISGENQITDVLQIIKMDRPYGTQKDFYGAAVL